MEKEKKKERKKVIALILHLRNGIVNMMSNALYKMLNRNRTEGGDDVVIATYIMPMPHKLMNITIDITTLIGGVLFPFAFSFLIPVSSNLYAVQFLFSIPRTIAIMY